MEKKKAVFIDTYAIPAIAFRKGVDDFRLRQDGEGLDDFSRWKLEPYSLAFYSGIGIKIKERFQFSVAYRWKYIYQIDEVIFNRYLFRNDNDPFLDKKYDNFNPTQIWVRLNYNLQKQS